MPISTYILFAVLAYLLGSIPFGYILVRLFLGADVRQTGSGNIGATNVARTGSKGLAIATLAPGHPKGYVAVAILTPMACLHARHQSTARRPRSPFWSEPATDPAGLPAGRGGRSFCHHRTHLYRLAALQRRQGVATGWEFFWRWLPGRC